MLLEVWPMAVGVAALAVALAVGILWVLVERVIAWVFQKEDPIDEDTRYLWML